MVDIFTILMKSTAAAAATAAAILDAKYMNTILSTSYKVSGCVYHVYAECSIILIYASFPGPWLKRNIFST